VIEDQVELVYYFLIKGLIPNSQNKEGDTPLHLAMKSKNKDMIKLLLDHGADVNICNLKKESPYDHSSVIKFI
jgi:ankyrin repeat protein